MKTKIVSITTAGHGHNEVTIQYRNGKQYKAVTDQVYYTDDYRSEVFTRADQRRVNYAKRALINIVKRANGLK